MCIWWHDCFLSDSNFNDLSVEYNFLFLFLYLPQIAINNSMYIYGNGRQTDILCLDCVNSRFGSIETPCIMRDEVIAVSLSLCVRAAMLRLKRGKRLLL